MKITLLAFILLTIHTGRASVHNQEAGPTGGKKVALVVGVANYQYIAPLENSLKDANDIDSVLKTLGFDVIKLLDPNKEQLANATATFGKMIKGNNSCLFYFSGHAVEHNGQNYILPRTANPYNARKLTDDAYALNNIIQLCEEGSVRTSIILLDACRNLVSDNPRSEKVLKKGLAHVNLRTRTFIAFAASPGQQAFDGEKNGAFTSALLKYIGEPQITIDELFNKVNKQVRLDTKNMQAPFKTSNLDTPYFFNKISQQQPICPFKPGTKFPLVYNPS
ncbi:hypothetical protein GFS24_17660 [Chitinophaga sp. SYP-B3965]|uniref:caspase family protein n=1 Tax=Chitinophaga sp. SYP-B3965 TaxID=2663120 RepID=UPI0012995167|nr:caspase family protein [Chitinophaga sp. SYP-B3965]MRG46953.1 hypothetical protein [Chitinophaga sp. SYP-B3965]